jgi:membrane protease YdiL (CAAX protease family)
VLFGLIHVLGGNPGPDNLIAGFFLQWAYMKSGTVLVPLAMHSSGNLIAFSAQVLSTILSPGAM